MSNAQNDVIIESLIEDYFELLDCWNGSDLGIENKLQDIAGQLQEDFNINVDELEVTR